MRLGISSYTFPWSFGIPSYPRPRNPLDAIGLLKKAESLGVEVVQICDNYPLNKVAIGMLDEISATSREVDVTIEVGTRGIDSENLLAYLNIAERLNARILRTTFETQDKNPDLEKIMTEIKRVLPLFEEKKISIALENYEQFKSKDLAFVVEKLNSPFIGVCLDTANSFGALESLEEVVNRLAPFTINLHLKDFDVMRFKHRMGFKIVGRPAGRGKLDIDWLFRVLEDKAKVEELSVIVEQWIPFMGSIEKTIRIEEKWATKSIEYLKEKMRKYSK